ncbi:hypothetical protein LSTR_LSTR000041 [Laodelphax striatellus]|uniref:Regulatory protein zeste n=1 Tax=Laodelphax striatellus TaxID=195883 RepID=A0A482X6D7_LAOST|nr:hypothetical protein LSTR_LSTR000041 [Laodelphax striatellus]
MSWFKSVNCVMSDDELGSNLKIVWKTMKIVCIILMKNEEWQTVAQEFNCEFPCLIPRTVDQLKLLYKNVKARARRKIADLKVERKKTGGGKCSVEVAENEQRLISVLTEQFNPLQSTYDDDFGHHNVDENIREVEFESEDVNIFHVQDEGQPSQFDSSVFEESPSVNLETPAPPSDPAPTTASRKRKQQDGPADKLLQLRKEFLKEEHLIKMEFLKKEFEFKEALFQKEIDLKNAIMLVTWTGMESVI